MKSTCQGVGGTLGPCAPSWVPPMSIINGGVSYNDTAVANTRIWDGRSRAPPVTANLDRPRTDLAPTRSEDPRNPVQIWAFSGTSPNISPPPRSPHHPHLATRSSPLRHHPYSTVVSSELTTVTTVASANYHLDRVIKIRRVPSRYQWKISPSEIAGD